MIFIYEKNRIYSKDESGKVIAEITFPRTGESEYTIDHTIVDSSLQGQGIAGKLVQAAVEEIQRQGGEVRSTCSYATKWIEKQSKAEQNKKITYFYLNGCPYCRSADMAIEELVREKPEYGKIEIERIDEMNPPAGISGYQYYYVPSMFIGKEKLYEAHPGQPYEEIKDAVRKAFERAVE